MPVYGWFTEGFDTADLKEAKQLLDVHEGRILGRLVLIESPGRQTQSGDILNATTIRFEPVSRPPKRNYKPGVGQRSAKHLIRLTKAKWVPNGPSEQPRRKLAVREASQACARIRRCTADRRK